MNQARSSSVLSPSTSALHSQFSELIEESIRDEIKRFCVARRILPILPTDENTTTVSEGEWERGDTGSRKHLVVNQQGSVPIIEISTEFRLTAEQLSAEPHDRNVLSLVRQAARALALAEDAIVFCGWQRSGENDWPVPNVDVLTENDAVAGLLQFAAAPDNSIDKWDEIPDFKSLYGLNTPKEIESGIQRLEDLGAQPPFVTILHPQVVADLNTRLIQERTRPIDVLPPDVTVLESRSMGHRLGLLVAVGGGPADLMMSRQEYELVAERIDDDGRHVFRLRHRFAIRVKRRDASYRLEFLKLPRPGERRPDERRDNGHPNTNGSGNNSSSDNQEGNSAPDNTNDQTPDPSNGTGN